MYMKHTELNIGEIIRVDGAPWPFNQFWFKIKNITENTVELEITNSSG